MATPISCRSGAGQGKSTGQRSTFFQWATTTNMCHCPIFLSTIVRATVLKGGLDLNGLVVSRPLVHKRCQVVSGCVVVCRLQWQGWLLHCVLSPADVLKYSSASTPFSDKTATATSLRFAFQWVALATSRARLCTIGDNASPVLRSWQRASLVYHARTKQKD